MLEPLPPSDGESVIVMVHQLTKRVEICILPPFISRIRFEIGQYVQWSLGGFEGSRKQKASDTGVMDLYCAF